MPSSKHPQLLGQLDSITSQFIIEYDQIPSDRKEVLKGLTRYIQNRTAAGLKTNLNFICTHNSRRSHLAQIWAQTASYIYAIPNVTCYSGGTEARAFNPRAVKAMREAGFKIEMKQDGSNPVYEVRFSKDSAPIMSFSKKYDDPFNSTKEFVAIMTCSHADENCPLVFGASARIAITYDDPKDFDDTPQEAVKYYEKVMEIGREMFFVFSEVKI